MIALRQQPISRRAALRGAGVALGLPWLEAMGQRTGAATGEPAAPVRIAALYMPNGAYPDAWTPRTPGRDFELPFSLQPLEGLRREVTVLSNLWNAEAKDGDGHYVKESSILTCARIKKTQGAGHHPRHHLHVRQRGEQRELPVSRGRLLGPPRRVAPQP